MRRPHEQADRGRIRSAPRHRLFGFFGVLSILLPLVLLLWTVVQVFWVERAIHAGADALAPVVEE